MLIYLWHMIVKKLLRFKVSFIELIITDSFLIFPIHEEKKTHLLTN
jgi:hypothetical protein